MRSWLPQTQQRNINIQMAPPVNTTKLLQTAFPSVAPYDQKKKGPLSTGTVHMQLGSWYLVPLLHIRVGSTTTSNNKRASKQKKNAASQLEAEQ